MEQRPPQHLGVVAIEKGAFESPSTKVANLTDLLINTLTHKTLTLQLDMKCLHRHKMTMNSFNTLALKRMNPPWVWGVK